MSVSKKVLGLVLLVLAVGGRPAAAQITDVGTLGMSGLVSRNTLAFDPVNKVYLAIVNRPPVTGRFLNEQGVQIGSDFVIATEPDFTAWASIAFGGPPNDPAFLVTYVVADLANNPKYGRLVRYVPGGAASVGPAAFVANVTSEWGHSEKAQNVWNGQKFIVGTRMPTGGPLPTFQVQTFDLSGGVSAPVNLGDGADYYGSPALACSTDALNTCIAVGFMAGYYSGYSGGSYGRLFNETTLAPTTPLFHLAAGYANEDQQAVYQAHTGRFLTEWLRGAAGGVIDTRLVNLDGSMSLLDLTKGFAGPGAGCNTICYNAATHTTLLGTKSGDAAALYVMELGDDGYPLNPVNRILITGWDGVVLDYETSIAANVALGQWLVTAELASSTVVHVIQGTPATSAGQPLAIVQGPVLPTAAQAVAYSAGLFASGGTPPYTWSVVSGTMPPGLGLSAFGISGTPTSPGSFGFRLRVTGTDSLYVEQDFTLQVSSVVIVPPGSPAGAQITDVGTLGMSGLVSRNTLAFDPVNKVYLAIVNRPPVTGRFLNEQGVQIGSDFVIATEPDFTAWASIAFGGPPNDPAFLVTYVVADLANNPKYGRLVRYVPGGAASVGPAAFVANVTSEWGHSEKAQNVWNGQKFIVGTRMPTGGPLPTFQVQTFDLSGGVSAPVNLGDGADYYGSPALACSTDALNTCIAVGFMAGYYSGYSGGSYGRLFNETTLAPTTPLFHLAAGYANEDQQAVYQAHTGRFLTEWLRGAAGGVIDTRLVDLDGSMSLLDLTKGFAGPGAGCNTICYNAATHTTLLGTKSGDAAALYVMELGDDGYPLNPANRILITGWDGVVLDYETSIAANVALGQWLVTAEMASSTVVHVIQGTLASGCNYGLSSSGSGVFTAGGGSGAVDVTTGSGCGWAATTSFSWIHTTSTGTGNGTVGYTVDANPGAARSGTISVGGQTYGISQAAFACSYSVNPSNSGALSSGGVLGNFAVTTGGSCAWSAGTNDSWIHTSSSGIGNGAVNYSVDANAGAARSGTILVGGQSFAVSQASFLQKAQLVSPAPSSTLANSTVTFQWTGGTGVAQYSLSVGSTAGASDLFSFGGSAALSVIVSGLPSDARTLYARLGSFISGAWQFNDYTLTAGPSGSRKAELTSPAPGSTLTATTVTFNWTGGTNVTRYWLHVGSTAGGFDLLSQDQGTNLATTVSGLPADGRTLYVRLWSVIAGVWSFTDYTCTATTGGSARAELTSPAPASTLTATTVAFAWTGGTNVTRYWLYVGSTAGGVDLLSQDQGTNLSATVSGLPADGRTLYVRLWSVIAGVWSFLDYTYTATGGLLPHRAELISPAPGSTLTNTTVAFAWTGGMSVTRYWLHLGSTAGGFDLLNQDQGTNLSTTVSGLPADGRPLYVRLWSVVDGVWSFTDYTCTATTGGSARAELVTPAATSTLSATTATFQWTGGTNVTRYWLYVGSTPGGVDLLSQDQGTNLSTTVSGLPTDGRTLYVRLWSVIAGLWSFTDYTCTATTGGSARGELTSAAPSSTLTASTVMFQWTGGTNVTRYWLQVGTTAGGSDLYSVDQGISLSTTVATLPTNGSAVYVRLWSVIGGVWQYIDYTFNQ